MFGRILGNTLVALSLLGAAPALAQNAEGPAVPAAPAAAVAEPAAPAATAPAAAPTAQPVVDPNLALNEPHENWSVRCFRVESPAPCDVLQIGTNSETQQRVLLISIAYLPARDAYAMQLIVPLGVQLSRGMTLAAGENSLTAISFNRCERDGCYVEMALPQATIDTLASMTEDTTITILPYNQAEALTLPFSVTGFAAAMARMKEEAEARAVEPAQ